MNRHGVLWVGLLLLAVVFGWISYRADKQQAVKMDNPKVVQSIPAMSPKVKTPEAPNPEVMEGTGIYVGRADNKFIKIVVGDATKTFYYPASDEKVALFEEDSVTFRYLKNDKNQLAITDIRVNPPTPQMGEGVFSGLVDNNQSVEIKYGDSSQTFQANDQVKTEIDKLVIGDKVIFGIKSASGGRKEITWITKQK